MSACLTLSKPLCSQGCKDGGFHFYWKSAVAHSNTHHTQLLTVCGLSVCLTSVECEDMFQHALSIVSDLNKVLSPKQRCWICHCVLVSFGSTEELTTYNFMFLWGAKCYFRGGFVMVRSFSLGNGYWYAIVCRLVFERVPRWAVGSVAKDDVVAAPCPVVTNRPQISVEGLSLSPVCIHTNPKLSADHAHYPCDPKNCFPSHCCVPP